MQGENDNRAAPSGPINNEHFEMQQDLMNYFALYFNVGDVEAMASLIRGACTPDCSVHRFNSDKEQSQPSKIIGLQNILQYATLLTEVIPDSIIEFEDFGKNDSTIVFGYSLTGTRLFDIHFNKTEDGGTLAHKIPLTGETEGGLGVAVNFSGVITLLFNEEKKISVIECRISNVSYY